MTDEEFNKEFARRHKLAQEQRVKKLQEHLAEQIKIREEHERKLAEEKLAVESRGGPWARSPENVDEDPNYERVASVDGNSYPSSIQHVVKHKATGNLWSCYYSIRDDDSDYDMSTNWFEVEAKEIVKIVYVSKNAK